MRLRKFDWHYRIGAGLVAIFKEYAIHGVLICIESSWPSGSEGQIGVLRDKTPFQMECRCTESNYGPTQDHR